MRLFTLRWPVIRMPWPLVVLGWALRLVAVLVLRLVLFAKLHPDTALLALSLGGLWLALEVYGVGPVGIVAAVFITAGWSWLLLSPATFDQLVTTPLRSRWRRQLVYRREWQPAMTVNGLDRSGELPALRRVTSTAALDVVRVTVLPGQTLDDWRAAAPRLAAAFGVRAVRPRKVPGRPFDLELWVRRGGRVAEADDGQPASGGAFRRDR